MKILIADDHDLVREMIAEVLVREAQAEVVSAASIKEALEVLSAQADLDLVLLDYNIPGSQDLGGFDALHKAAPDIPIALLSGVATRNIAEKVLAAGGRGFLPKTLKPKSLVNAVKFMMSGEVFFPVEFMNAKDPAEEKSAAFGMTPRETEVLNGICDGLTNKEIALRLDLQEVTVKLHVKTLTRKLQAKNRTHAAMIARDLNLIAAS